MDIAVLRIRKGRKWSAALDNANTAITLGQIVRSAFMIWKRGHNDVEKKYFLYVE